MEAWWTTGPTLYACLCPADGGELVERDAGQFAVGQLQQDHIAKDLVVDVAAVVQAVTAPLRANDLARGLRGPTRLAYGDQVRHLDPVAGRQLVEAGRHLVSVGRHRTAGGSRNLRAAGMGGAIPAAPNPRPRVLT